MISIDPLFGREYDIDNYNCVHFLCDAWLHVTGQDLEKRMGAFLAAVSNMKAERQTMREFKRLKQPDEPCIVFFKSRHQSSHVGLFLRHKVLHLSRDGVQFQPLHVVASSFEQVRFYQ